jgi:hypothetical protein
MQFSRDENGTSMFLQDAGHLPTSLHGAKIQKNTIFFIAVENSNLSHGFVLIGAYSRFTMGLLRRTGLLKGNCNPYCVSGYRTKICSPPLMQQVSVWGAQTLFGYIL